MKFLFSTVDQHKEAMNHFVAGKRHLLVKDLNAAVTSLALVGTSWIFVPDLQVNSSAEIYTILQWDPYPHQLAGYGSAS